VGSPDLALQVGVERMSFRDAMDRTAILMDQDGLTIEEFKECAELNSTYPAASAVANVQVDYVRVWKYIP
jgi:hypothetical protein